jgi:hypothetical protein
MRWKYYKNYNLLGYVSGVYLHLLNIVSVLVYKHVCSADPSTCLASFVLGCFLKESSESRKGVGGVYSLSQIVFSF